MSSVSEKYSHVFTQKHMMDSPFQLSKELGMWPKGKAPTEVFAFAFSSL